VTVARSLVLGAGLGATALACELALPIHETPSSEPVTGPAANDAGARGEAGTAEAGASSASLLFKSGFEDVTLEPPRNCSDGNCEQTIDGGASPWSWPPTFWGGGPGVLQLLVAPGASGITTANIGDHMQNEIATVTGPRGGTTKALHQRLLQGTLDGFNYSPSGTKTAADEGDLYVVHSMKVAENLPQQLGTTGYRQVLILFQGNKIPLTLLWYGAPNGTFWSIKGDSPSNWERSAQEHLPVPNTWFKLEIFWHPARDDTGRVWIAVDGAPILDYRGANLASDAPVDGVEFLMDGTPNAPSEQWVDDLEIWTGFPDGAAPH
jgi:hypothetical protein